MNNQNLSDEHCYIINREKAKKYIGNALSKPKVLLSRTETKCTNESDASRDKPITYGAATARGAVPQSAMYGSYGGSGNLYEESSETFSSFNGFLKHSSLIIANVDQDDIKFEVPKYYQNVRILVTSQSFAIEKNFALPSANLLSKDLRHSGLDETKSGLTMARNSYKLQKGETIKINRSSVWASISGQSIYAYSRVRGQLLKAWVLGWETYDLEKKKEVYSKNVSH